MKAGIICFTKMGLSLAQRIESILSGELLSYDVEIFSLAGRSENKDLPSLSEAAALCMQKQSCIFIGACGIAVRAIAPYVQDKKTDAAVLVLDEKGRFVIPLLSGHIGGANEIGKILSEELQSELVLTTSSDVNEKLAVDVYAKENDLIIADMTDAKKFAAAQLDGRECKVLISSRFRGNESDQETVVQLIPKSLYVGIGCKRDTPAGKLKKFVEKIFLQNQLDMRAIAAYASIDLKKDEPGILAFKEDGTEVYFYSARKLQEAEGNFSTSSFVNEITGVDNVCERSAALASNQGVQILPKTCEDGMTIAIYEKVIAYTKPRDITFEIEGNILCYES